MHPDAGMIGFFSVTFPILTVRSTIPRTPANRIPVLRCRRGEFLMPVHLKCFHADITGAQTAGHHLLHSHLTGNSVLFAELFHQQHQPV